MPTPEREGGDPRVGHRCDPERKVHQERGREGIDSAAAEGECERQGHGGGDEARRKASVAVSVDASIERQRFGRGILARFRG